MRKAARLIGILLFGALLSACASDRMRALDRAPALVTSPAADKATLVFFSPFSDVGGAMRSSVFDISDGRMDLIGIVAAGRKVAYGSNTGRRRFMVIGESADFMEADLLPGKTYHARIVTRLGAWKARFSLVPVVSSDPKLEGELNACKWVENSPASYAWAQDNMPSIRAKLAKYLPEWERKAAKPFLAASDGR